MLLPVNNISVSLVNGPGTRYVIWVQGCKLNCKGCFNPDTHSYNEGSLIDIVNLSSEINSNSSIQGVTITGGEPFDYAKEIVELLKMLKPSLTSVVFSGYTLKEILKDTQKIDLLKRVDLVISGRYDHKSEHPFLTKKFLNMTGRVDLNYFKPQTIIEYSINKHVVTKTGIFKIH